MSVVREVTQNEFERFMLRVGLWVDSDGYIIDKFGRRITDTQGDEVKPEDVLYLETYPTRAGDRFEVITDEEYEFEPGF